MIILPEDSGYAYLAYMTNFAGSQLLQADLASLSVDVWDVTSNVSTYSAALNVTETVYDTPQTNSVDARWPSRASTGYNVAVEVPYTATPTGGHRYSFELTFTDIEGRQWKRLIPYRATHARAS